MSKSLVEFLIKSLRDAGMVLSVEGERLSGKMANGQKCSREVHLMSDQLLTIKDEAIAFLQAEANHSIESDCSQASDKQPETYQSTDVVLKGITVVEALDIGERIKAGSAELVGKVVYHKSTGLCDLAYRPLEVKP